ncbi:MAG: hypothetical protein GX177_08595 [Firmicutes bacterium]|jgi:outer membrane lipoprotein-sorting protein|nr:hypothetical protein [Bacillota bacterium]
MKKFSVVVLVCCLLAGITAAVSAAELDFAGLADVVEQKLAGIEDVRMIVELDLVQQGQPTSIVMNVKSSKSHQLTRVELLAPDVVAGQIMVIDLENNEMKMYMPVLNQIIVQPLANSAAGLGFNLEFTDLTQTLNLQGLSGEIKEVTAVEAGLEYLVVINDLGDQLPFMQGIDVDPQELVQYIWIDAEYIPYRVEGYQGTALLGKLVLTEYEFNSGIAVDELLEMPDVPVLQF